MDVWWPFLSHNIQQKIEKSSLEPAFLTIYEGKDYIFSSLPEDFLEFSSSVYVLWFQSEPLSIVDVCWPFLSHNIQLKMEKHLLELGFFTIYKAKDYIFSPHPGDILEFSSCL